MTGIDFLIIFATILTTALFGMQHNVRSWWSDVLTKRRAFFIAFMLFLAPSLGSSRGIVQSYLPDATRSVRVVVITFLFVAAIRGILTHSGTWRRAGIPAQLMVAYSLFAMASAFWSVDSFISLWKGFEVLSLVLATIYLAGQIREIQDIRWLLNMISLVMLFFIISLFYGIAIAPSLAFGYQTGGMGSSMSFAATGVFPTMNPNTVTQFGMLLATLTLALALNEEKRSRTWSIWIIVLLGIVAAILGHSRTSIFAGAFAITGILFFGRHLILATATMFVGVFAVILASFGDLVTSYIYRGQTQSAFESMSGRTIFWERVWEQVVSHPWFGQGFYAAHRIIFGISSVDNTYLEVLMDIGFVGLVIFVLPVAMTAITLIKTIPIRKNTSKMAALVWLQLMSIFIILFLRSVTGPSFQVLSGNVPLFVILIISANALRHLRTKEPGAASLSNELTELEKADESHRILTRRKHHPLQSRTPHKQGPDT